MSIWSLVLADQINYIICVTHIFSDLEAEVVEVVEFLGVNHSFAKLLFQPRDVRGIGKRVLLSMIQSNWKFLWDLGQVQKRNNLRAVMSNVFGIIVVVKLSEHSAIDDLCIVDNLLLRTWAGRSALLEFIACWVSIWRFCFKPFRKLIANKREKVTESAHSSVNFWVSELIEFEMLKST